MSLTKQQRDALAADDFAVPGRRAFPIHDERHVSMAWAQMGKASGLTETERADARLRIMARAEVLGIDTAAWSTVKSLQIHAMAIDLPEVTDHPNRMPFSGVLLKLNQPSCAAPHGSNGKLVMMSSATAQAALPSLAGMAVDFTPDFDGHDPQRKIGVITAASIEGDDLKIEGFIYAADFPTEAADIKANKDALGFSFEAQKIYVSSLDTDPLDITSCVFTGAAILLKDKAAYTTTSLAAAADTGDLNMTEDELKAILASALKPITDKITTIEASQAALGEKIEAGKELHAKVQPHADKLRVAAEAMKAAGIGVHAESGQVAVLHRMADNMEAEAMAGSMPHVYRGHVLAGDRYYAGAETAKDQGKAIADAIAAATAPLNEQIASLTTKLDDKLAAARAGSAEPERKTLTPQITSLLAKAGISTPEGDAKLSVAQIDKALAGQSIGQRMQTKAALAHAGLIDA